MTTVQRAKGNLILGVLAVLVLAATHASAQSLIYSQTYPWTTATRPIGIGHAVPSDQRVESVRSSWKTEIYSVSVLDGSRKLLFSDQGPHFEIYPAEPLVAAAHGKAYMKGVERRWEGMPHPGVYSDPAAIYEIALDGSKALHKISELKERSSGNLFIDPAGAELGYIEFADGKNVVSIYDVASGRRLQSWDATAAIQSLCPDCLVEAQGWLADGRLFLTLQLGAGDEAPSPKDKPGTLLLSVDGKVLSTLPAELGRVRREGYSSDNESAPTLLGQTTSGDYVFKDFAFKKETHPRPPVTAQTFIVIANPQSKKQKQLAIEARRLMALKLSPAGDHVSFREDRPVANYRTELHLWSKDMKNGQEKELFVQPVPASMAREANVAVTVLGWWEEK